MDGIKKFITTYQTQLKQVITLVAILVAIVLGGISLIKAANGFFKGNVGDGIKHLVFAIVIVLIAVVGVTGLIQLVNNISTGVGAGLFDTQKINVK